jgi:hypothetical protein
MLFDKTGTLTTGTPRVTGVEALDGFDPDDVLPHWHRYRSTLWPAPSSPQRAPWTFHSLCRMTQKRFPVAAWPAMWMASKSC